MIPCGWKLGSLGTLLIALCVYFYRQHLITAKLESVLDGLLRAETAVAVDTNLRIAIGFGSCVDVIGPGMTILEQYGALPPNVPEHFDAVHNQGEFEKVFAYFFQHGAAAE